MDILIWIVVGLIGGWLAGMVMGSGFGLIGDIIIGIVGGLLGGWISTNLLKLPYEVTGINWPSILVAFGGAVVLLLLVRLVSGRR